MLLLQSLQLFQYASNGDVEGLKRSIRHGKVNVEHRDDGGQTPLIVAAANNQPGAIKCLIEEGKADIEARVSIEDTDCLEVTALLLAIKKGNLEAVKMLLEKGADPNAKDYWGRNSIQCAIKFGDDVDLWLPEHHLEYGHLDIVKELLKYEVDLSVKIFKGQNLLHIAAEGRNGR